MSLTRVVPAVVPLLFHSSFPLVPSSATKNSVPFTSVRYPGKTPSGTKFLTRVVPAAVPSLFHKPAPCVLSEPVKNSVPLTLVSQLSPTSLTSTVPAAVPSLLHNPPRTPSKSEKNRVPLRLVSHTGTELALPGLMSLMSTVPAAVPSLFHSSRPLVPSSAEKNNVPLTFVAHDPNK